MNNEIIDLNFDFDSKVKQLKELQINISELKEKEEQLKWEIKQYMSRNGMESARVDYLTVKYQERVSYRFDLNLFKTEHTALYNSYLNPTTMHILRIK